MKNKNTTVQPSKRYGHWVVQRYAQYARGGHQWLCQCDCGTEKEVRQDKLIKGESKSCGCLRSVTHGLSRRGNVTPELPVWNAMLQRCHNPNNRQYPDYGRRGIHVCGRWHTFINFYEDMGARPQGGTIERIDNDKGYCRKNCRWATREEQSLNKRNNRFITVGGTTLTLAEWSQRAGISHTVILHRIRAGWPERLAVTAPKGSRLSRLQSSAQT